MMNATFFLAEGVTPGTFDRWNFQGCILGDEIQIPEFPYRLTVYVVSIFQFPDRGSFAEKPIIFVGFSSEASPDEVSEEQGELGASQGAEIAKTMVVVAPIIWQVFGPGMLTVRIQIGSETFASKWRITAGVGPVKGALAPSATGEIVAAGKTFDVPGLLASATRDLVIIDAYLPPENLEVLLASVGANVRVRIPVPPKDVAHYKNAKPKLLVNHPHLELRAQQAPGGQGVFHDRFVVVNSHEAYCFGTSLKQVCSGRVTRVAKLIDGREVADLLQVFEAEWSKSMPF